MIDITTTFAVISWKKEAYRIMIADKIKNARTILYYITNLVFLTTNSSKYASEEKPVPAGIIISTLMYALAAYFILAIPAELLWQKYIEQTYPSAVVGFMVVYWALRIVICGGIFVKGIIRAKSLSDDHIGERWDIDGREEASSKSV